MRSVYEPGGKKAVDDLLMVDDGVSLGGVKNGGCLLGA